MNYLVTILVLVIGLTLGANAAEETSKKASTDPHVQKGQDYFIKSQFMRAKDKKEAENNLDRAIHEFNQALQTNPKDNYAYNLRGLAYLDKGQYDKAMADFNKMLELTPGMRWPIVTEGPYLIKQSSMIKPLKNIVRR